MLAAADIPPPHPSRLGWTRVPRIRARRATWNLQTEAALTNPIFALTDVDYLEFGRAFEGSLDAVPIERVAWPTSLRQLTFGGGFNQPIERATFSSSLQRLTFGQVFNQPIERVEWPDSLQALIFGEHFNYPVDNVRWPASLQEVSFGCCEATWDYRTVMGSDFDQCISKSVWPASLRRITLGGMFRQSLQGLGTWMPNLEALRMLEWDIDNIPNDSLLVRGIEWPKGLRELTVFKESILDGVVIPSTVQVYRPSLFV
ncbi:unnamed protein product [Ectocarpus sp. 6 AP-2014]